MPPASRKTVGRTSGKAVEKTVGKTVDKTVDGTVDGIGQAIAVGNGASIHVKPDLAGVISKFVANIDYIGIKAAPGLDGQLKGDLKQLLDLPATLDAAATILHDGRLVKLVLVTIQDRTGHSRPGIPVHLLDMGGEVLDRAYTSRTGLAILQFPRTHTMVPGAGHDHGDLTDTTGTIKILDGTDKGILQPVAIPAGSQFADVTKLLDTLPPLPAHPADTANGLELWPPAGTGDDPLTNLPPDFTPELCDAITAKSGQEGDSLLSVIGKGNDFRTRRTPLVKRLSVVRNGKQTVSATSKEPRRYLVRLRQSWTFLGYTLGELAQVDALDPGEILDETVGTVERSVEEVSRLVDQAKSFATSGLLDTLSQTNKIDTLVKAATSTEVSAKVDGWGIGIPGLFGAGSIGATAGVKTGATTSTNVDTSLNVNHAISTAQTFVNEAVHSATSTLTSLARTITSKLGRVSPLLSRVTNLLRWRVYENYAVCTHVEDVLELVSVKVLDIPAAQMPKNGKVTSALFSPEEIVEYRRFFEPALLESRLRVDYPALVDAVRIGAAGRPVNHVTIEVSYAASIATGHLTVEINGSTAELTLLPGSTRAKGVLRFQQLVFADAITSATLSLSQTANLPNIWLMPQIPDNLISVDVTSVSLWAGVETGAPASVTSSLGTALHTDRATATREQSITFTIPAPLVDATTNPLWLHVNQNPSYYLGVLAQAALLYPSLREDSDKLSAIPADVWRLPIIGFEGNHIVVAKDPDLEAPDVVKLLSDPGAATLVQLAAPGSYSEALQGLLSLADAEGLIHPKLIPAPAPAVPPLSIIDLTGKQLVPVTPNGTGVPAGGGGLPIPHP
jgi:hypothetical protein